MLKGALLFTLWYAPRLRACPTYTVIAEKLHAIAVLGMTISRLEDYFDLSVLLERETLDKDLLAQAIKATFERRGMSKPNAVPMGLWTYTTSWDISLTFSAKYDIRPRRHGMAHEKMVPARQRSRRMT